MHKDPKIPKIEETSATALQVAQAVGVSVYTVARAFSGSPTVADGTRWRILEMAREMGYRPEMAMEALSRRMWGRVAFVRGMLEIRGEIYQEMLAGMEVALSERSFEIALAGPPSPSSVGEWLQSRLSSGSWTGLAILLDNYDTKLLEFLQGLKIPVVLIYHTPTGKEPAQLTSLSYDTGGGIQQVVRHLVELRHEHIAYFGIAPILGEDVRREQAFRAGIESAGLKIREEWIIPNIMPKSLPSGAAAFDYVFSRSGIKPTAIVCGGDTVALGALSGARRWGKSIPQDLSITGFDDNFWLDFYTPSVTTVRQSGWDMGQEAARLLLEQFDFPDVPPRTVILPTQLIVRESTAPPAASPRKG